MEEIREALINDIREAFAEVSREDGVTLHEADVIDDYGSAAARAEARKLDTEERWQDVPDADIEKYDWILSFLDLKGFKYYIPAYMVWSLKNYQTSSSASVDATIYALAPPSSPDLQAWKLERWQVFDTLQAKTICRFLRFAVEQAVLCMDARVAQEALDSYWGKYCQPTSQ